LSKLFLILLGVHNGKALSFHSQTGNCPLDIAGKSTVYGEQGYRAIRYNGLTVTYTALLVRSIKWLCWLSFTSPSPTSSTSRDDTERRVSERIHPKWNFHRFQPCKYDCKHKCSNDESCDQFWLNTESQNTEGKFNRQRGTEGAGNIIASPSR